MNLEKLEYPGLDDDITKNISYSHNVFFREGLSDKRLKVDENLIILDNKSEVGGVDFLRKFVSEKRTERKPGGTFFCFTHSTSVRKRPYDAMDRVRVFLFAVRIYTGKRADCFFDFSVKNSKTKEYYLPFDLRSKYDPYEHRNASIIESRKDFNTIKRIHKRLVEAKLEKPLQYSKLYNAVEFFRHAYEEHWILLKTTLFFTSLESLFSDSAKSEVTEKIAIRTAYLLYPKDSQKRKGVYTFIKRGYEIRSLFVHGADSEAGVQRIMKKFEKERGVEHYSFHHDFIEELHLIVCSCLKRCILNDAMYKFFNQEKHKDQEEQKFYTDLVL